MKIKLIRIIVALCLIVLVWFLYDVIFGKSEQKALPVIKERAKVNSVVIDTKQDSENSRNLKRQQMADKFVDLKEIRKTIRMRLSRLSSRLRRSAFPPEQARTISQDMRRASYLLKSPKLLGAFSNIREIEGEIEQLSNINVKLDAIKQSLDEKRENKP